MVDWQMDNVVSVHRIPLAGWPTVEDMRRAPFELLAALQLDPGSRPVVLKPNVVRGDMGADSGIVVHPAFLDGVVQYLRTRAVSSILVGEGGGAERMRDMLGVHFVKAGYTEWAEQAGVTLADFNTDDVVRVPVAGRIFQAIPIARPFADPNSYVINVPKLKTHNLAITTLSLKNLQGVVRLEERHMCRGDFPRYEGDRGDDLDLTGIVDVDTHERWAHKVCDIYQARRPDLNLIDGVIGRDGTGFQHGNNLACGLAIAGVNGVAVDTVASYLMGFDPANLTYLRVAGERGLGPNRLDQIAVYTVCDGGLAPCTDLAALRVAPAFQVRLRESFVYRSYENVPYANADQIPESFRVGR